MTRMNYGLMLLFAVGLSLSAAGAGADVLSLDGAWRLDYFPVPASGCVRRPSPLPAHETVRATVPGNCELDLVRAGVLPPPEFGDNVKRLRPYEGYQWLYTRAFDCPGRFGGPDGRTTLVFEGIDTLADVFLNGEKLGESANMLIPRRFDVTDRLRTGTNTLQVLIRPIAYECQFDLPDPFGRCYEFFGWRKASHMGGWDILPRAYVSGLWRGVRIERKGNVRTDAAHWVVRATDVTNRTAIVQVRFRVQAPYAAIDSLRWRATLARKGKTVATAGGVLGGYFPGARLTVREAEFWWPRGMGEPALYEARTEVLSADGKTVLDAETVRVGLRIVSLEREDVYGPDRPGKFLFRVNGEPVFVRGTNWVPLDALHARDPQHLARTLAMVEDLNCNLVRVWGGSVYESDAFYDWCDAHGVLVWQDFMTACDALPQGDAYARAIAEETREVVLRLRNHPSLALWSGNNENDVAFSARLGPAYLRDPNTDRISRKVIPDVLASYDPTRPYLPSSPYTSADVFAGRAQPSEDHLWGERGYYKVPFYTNAPCLFASEMGYHGCPNRASLERMMPADKLYPWTDPATLRWNDLWELKGCYRGRNDLMTKQVRILFGNVSTNLDVFIAQSQFVQAEALKTMVELFRSRKFDRNTGLVWWNVRDGWPLITDAIVDYWGGKKRAYFALREAQRDVVCLIRDDHRLLVVNDTRETRRGHVRVTDRASGRVAYAGDYVSPANAAKVLAEIGWTGQGVFAIDYSVEGELHHNHFLYGEPPFDWQTIERLAP